MPKKRMSDIEFENRFQKAQVKNSGIYLVKPPNEKRKKGRNSTREVSRMTFPK